ncbi:hypothetical protein Q9966_016496 [Columba livia]|nr:hypothetical protein Q9966_016496 [Columba livia]KAK2512024.1 hypothetical protein Q9966_016496 [Columba livia]
MSGVEGTSKLIQCDPPEREHPAEVTQERVPVLELRGHNWTHYSRCDTLFQM